MTTTDLPAPRATTPDPAWLDALVARLAEQHGIVGATVAVDVAGAVVTAVAGLASLRTRQPVTPDTLFQIGSITKVYTATLVMGLVDEGLVALDDPITRHLPELRAADHDLADVTVAHLLSHTGGLQGDVFDDMGRDTDAIARLVVALGELPIHFRAGQQFSYCNAGWSVLGRLAEVVTGLPWATALRQRVLEPAGLTATMSLPEEVILHPHAVGHMPGADGLAVAPLWTLGMASAPAGSLTCATAADLVAFGRLHLAGGTAPDGTAVLTAGTAAAMRQPRVTLPAGNGLADRWGLGWYMADWADADGQVVEAVGHDGATLGQGATLRLVPDRDLVLAAAVCGGEEAHAFLSAVTTAVAAEVAGLVVPARETAPAEPAAIDPARVVGTYASYSTRITIREGEDGAFAVDVAPSGAAAAIQPPVSDLPAVPLDGSRLLVTLGPVSMPGVCYDLPDGSSWLLLGGRATRRTS